MTPVMFARSGVLHSVQLQHGPEGFGPFVQLRDQQGLVLEMPLQVLQQVGTHLTVLAMSALPVGTKVPQ